MKETSQISALVIDGGLFLPLALKLGPSFKRLLYHTPSERAFSIINDACLGDGFEDGWNVERCDDFWEELKDIDLVIVPEIGNSGIQQHLESIGKLVWGSRQGDNLELKRGLLKKVQREVGLAVPKHKPIIGLDDLRDFLKVQDEVYVKVSRFRGTTETFHHIDYDHSLPLLDHLAVLLGPLQNDFPFMVEWPIETKVELGYDGYCVDGKYPKLGIQGIECKDRGLIASVQSYDELPEEVTEINDAMGPVFAKYRYRNFLSTEIREGTMIDITCRAGVPSIESQMELWSNLPEIIVAGAAGEVVDPIPAAKFAVECIIHHSDDEARWRVLEVPEEAKDAVKPYFACYHDGLYCFPPFPHSSEIVASIVVIGDDLAEAIGDLKEMADLLSDQPVTVKIDAISDMLKTIHESEKEGVEFSSEEVPQPEEVIT
jgi:hypothetical protein